jgi:pilus assembly protein CpaF
MIINPFEINESVFEKEDILNKTNKKNIKIDMFELQNYVVNNYIEYLKKDLREELKIKIYEYLYEKYNIKNEEFIEKIISNLYNKIFGYDILQKYIENEEVTDIRAVKYNLIYIKKKGKWEKIKDEFENDKYFEEFIRYTVLKNNGNINFDVPIVIISDKKYNLRVEAGILPANSISPSIVIRVHRPNKNISLENLFVNYEMLDSDAYKIINKAINERKNIVISGKGGSGKTSLLRAIIDKLPDEIAITTNEETTELYIDGKNIIQREVIESREEKRK